MPDQDPNQMFEFERKRLFGLAYRMLGSVADAEDMVQDTYMRWRKVDFNTIDNPQAFLTTIITRLSLDHLKSAKTKREKYVGEWLPEPLLTDETEAPDEIAQKADDISIALMLTLEELSAPGARCLLVA